MAAEGTQKQMEEAKPEATERGVKRTLEEVELAIKHLEEKQMELK